MPSSQRAGEESSSNAAGSPSSPSSSSPSDDEAIMDKMKRMGSNCLQATGLCCFKMKEQSQIQALEFKIATRQKKFGVDYLTLVEDKASDQQLKDCLDEALRDIGILREKVNQHEDEIDRKVEKVNEKIDYGPDGPPNNTSTDRPGRTSNDNDNKNNNSNNNNRTSHDDEMGSPYGSSGGGGGSGKDSNSKKPIVAAASAGGGKSTMDNKKPKDKKRTSTAGKTAKDKSNKKVAVDKAGIPDEFKDADPSKWNFTEQRFSGSAKFEEKGKEETIKGKTIEKGKEIFKANPGKYTAMFYPTVALDWPIKDQQYTLVHRRGTVNWRPQKVSPKGPYTVLMNEYETLPKFKNNTMPKAACDKYTDAMKFCGRKIHNKNKPMLPGRGMGICDSPLLKIIGDVDPSDIEQGSVGDCWLLSAISSLAEFDGAVKKLFRKTPNLDQRPLDAPNMYTITLWDLPTWKEVDIQIDERLCTNPSDPSQLLASKPSEDGELWVCYLEKAFAVHCGGWDKIVGGQCTHAWQIFTGCRDQLMIQKDAKTGKYKCFSKYDPTKEQWAKQTNSPHDCDPRYFTADWPKVGGGGSQPLTQKELFLKMVAWDEQNYIVAAGTSGVSDSKSTDGGLVDDHAYSVIESVANVAGTGKDLLKVRNPWGKGEIEDGEFDDDGPGWDAYPQIKKQLKPVVADDGIFWVTKEEFFSYFPTVYVSCSDMTEFKED